MAEGNSVDDPADRLDLIGRDMFPLKERACICIMLCREQLVVIRIVQKRCQRSQIGIAVRLGSCDLKRVPVHPHRVADIVTAGVVPEQILYE